MKKVLFIISLVTGVLNTSAQSPTLVHPTLSDQYGGSITIHSMMAGTTWNLHNNYYTVSTGLPCNADMPQTDSIVPNLCAGNYSIYYTNDLGNAVSYNVDLTMDYTGTICENTNLNVQIVSNQEVSSGNNNDGNFILLILAPLNNMSTNLPMPVNPGGIGTVGGSYYEFVDLSNSNYYITVSDFWGCSMSYTFSPGYNNSDVLSAEISSLGISEDALCDGEATVEINGGTEPYSILYSTGETTSSVSDLCAGLNSVLVTDAAGSSINVDFIVPSPGNILSSDAYLDSVIVDSVYNQVVTNCLINYSMIDSASITSMTTMINNMVMVYWEVYYNDSIAHVNSLYSLEGGNGIYTLALQLYCPNKSTDENYVFYDRISYSNSVLGTDELSPVIELNVSPNPFVDEIGVSGLGSHSSKIIIRDVFGKIVINAISDGPTTTLDVSDLSGGTYFMSVENGNSVVTRKITK